MSQQATKRKLQSKPKVKTGCITCRIRKVKCDESRPACQKCSTTGRKCDGYQTKFIDTSTGCQQSATNRRSQARFGHYGPEEIDRLNRYFSTKTLFDVELDCSAEASEILRSSRTDPLVRAAIASLVALREDLEAVGDDPATAGYTTTSYQYGLQQYSLALRGLTSTLPSPTTEGLKSLLYCCQVFISIEQISKNYAAVGQHIVQGLNIMQQYRARPGLVSTTKLMPAQHQELPALDVFIIKVFTAPCRFIDSPPQNESSPWSSSSCPLGTQGSPSTSSNNSLAPDLGGELIKIARSTIVFLRSVSNVQTLTSAFHLLVEKAGLLDALEAWNARLVAVQGIQRNPQLISICFLQLFHQTLKLILLQALDHSPGLLAQLSPEIEELKRIANDIGERVSTYVTHTGIKQTMG